MQKFIVFIVFLVGGIWLMNNFSYKPEPKHESQEVKSIVISKTPQELRKEQIESQFSVLDGSHKKVVDEIKKQMKNPKSYEHIKTVYFDRETTDNMVKVVCEFRGTNAFNAVVKNTAEALVDINGNIKSFNIY
jgi:hypothetical protein